MTIIFNITLLIMGTISDTIVEKPEHSMCHIIFFSRKSCHFIDKVGKYGTARQVTDDNIIRRMGIAYWVAKATNKYSDL